MYDFATFLQSVEVSTLGCSNHDKDITLCILNFGFVFTPSPWTKTEALKEIRLSIWKWEGASSYRYGTNLLIVLFIFIWFFCIHLVLFITLSCACPNIRNSFVFTFLILLHVYYYFRVLGPLFIVFNSMLNVNENFFFLLSFVYYFFFSQLMCYNRLLFSFVIYCFLQCAWQLATFVCWHPLVHSDVCYVFMFLDLCLLYFI